MEILNEHFVALSHHGNALNKMGLVRYQDAIGCFNYFHQSLERSDGASEVSNGEKWFYRAVRFD